MRLLRRIGRLFLWLVAAAVTLAVVGVIIAFFAVRALIEPPSGKFGKVKDEAMLAGRTVQSLPPAADPYFVAMDKELLKKPAAGKPYPKEIMEVAEMTNLAPEAVRQAAIRGQNTWLVWTGGNDRFWNWAAAGTIGSFDLLKTISTYPGSAYGRHNRFRYLGLLNEPCFKAPTGPDPKHYGLWIDERKANCPDDPFANAIKYPGVKIGARGKTMPVGSYYGEPTGVIGLRLFPNPDFDAKAKAAWDPVRFYTDPGYYNKAKLVRPYRVGMSCAFCHVGPSPIHPPKDVENPTWSELASNTGAQYFWVDRIFFWNTRPRSEKGAPAPNEGNLLFQLFHTNPPGSLDTSLVSTDYMNDPRTMNAVYEVAARLKLALAHGAETLEGDELDNEQFQDFEETKALAPFFDPKTATSYSMRVLKDGGDSVGGLGALNRVYLNIGLFSEEWLLHFRAFVGGQKISPIRIADARRNSVYWQATEKMTPDMAIFFLVTARADRLAEAPGGQAILNRDPPDKVARGQEIFADNCAACHSSKQPQPDPVSGVDQGICKGGGTGPQYRECWNRYWAWTQTDAYKQAMLKLIRATDSSGHETFLDGNYLSTERRVPLDVLKVNACSPIATNGLKGDIWDNFTSSTYKTMPPPGPVTVYDPVSGGATMFQPLGNGRGYVRPASLVSLWSTAPYLQNNSVGYEPYAYRSYKRDGYKSESGTSGYGNGLSDKYGPRSCPSADPNDPEMPCTANRVATFEKAIHAMLEPSLRRTDKLTTEPVPGYIYRTTAPACLMMPAGYVPDGVKRWDWLLKWLAPWAFKPDGSIALGPLPKDFPINALVNTKLLPDNDEPDMAGHMLKMLKAMPTLLSAFKQLGGQCSPEELADPGVEQHATEVVKSTHLIDTLVGLSKCPDYVVNRGHYFGAGLSDGDREALIAYLKRF